jgi:branched-chain amino acid transport system permease protein
MADMIDFLQTVINGALTGLVYGLVAFSFIFIYRASRIMNLAQGEVVIAGAFLIWTFSGPLALPLWLSVILALVSSAAIGVVIERTVFRPLIGQSAFAVVMASIALLILMRGLTQAIWGAENRPFPEILPLGAVEIGPFLLNQTLLIGAIATIVLVEAVHWFFLNTREGLRLAAVTEDHYVAASLGISLRRATAIAVGIGFCLAALAAVVFLSGRMLSLSAAEIGFRALPVALLGGLESVRGAPAAGIMIGVGEALASYYVDPLTNGAASPLFPYAMMIAVLLIRPQGLFGWKIIERI